MAIRRVYVIWANPLFHESICALLNHPGVAWTGASSDLGSAGEEIRRLQADTILFERTGRSLPGDVIQFLGEDRRDVRIIEFSLQGNDISLYHRERRVMTKAGDLLQLVLGQHAGEPGVQIRIQSKGE